MKQTLTVERYKQRRAAVSNPQNKVTKQPLNRQLYLSTSPQLILQWTLSPPSSLVPSESPRIRRRRNPTVQPMSRLSTYLALLLERTSTALRRLGTSSLSRWAHYESKIQRSSLAHDLSYVAHSPKLENWTLLPHRFLLFRVVCLHGLPILLSFFPPPSDIDSISLSNCQPIRSQYSSHSFQARWSFCVNNFFRLHYNRINKALTITLFRDRIRREVNHFRLGRLFSLTTSGYGVIVSAETLSSTAIAKHEVEI